MAPIVCLVWGFSRPRLPAGTTRFQRDLVSPDLDLSARIKHRHLWNVAAVLFRNLTAT